MDDSSALDSREHDAIRLNGIDKSHRSKQILHSVGFRAGKGRVTAFLGPNGAGKSSTLRILMGLDSADSGSATFAGTPYTRIPNPLLRVGALFDGVGGAKTRRVTTHLRIVADSNGIPTTRVTEVLAQVGMAEKSRARIGTLSLGEGQRVGLAAALLGDPQFLVLDEPTNGLDPGGIRWFRKFIVEQARCGKTILLSSHMLNEVQAIADDVVVIAQGRIVLEDTLEGATEKISSLEDLFFELTEVA